MFQFENPNYLYALGLMVPLVALFVGVLRWKVKAKAKLGNPRLINQLTSNYSPTKYLLKVLAILIAIAFLILSVANYRKPTKEQATKVEGIDVMIALDVSNSMLAEDEKPTRLDKAKRFVKQLSEQLQNDRVGLILFAGHAYLQMPLTADGYAAKMFLANANPALIPWQGTVISEAMSLCNNSLATKEKKYKAAILITDGEDHDPKAIETAKQLLDRGVVVHTIGLGSEQGAFLKMQGTNTYKRDIHGDAVFTKLNKQLLTDIATITGGSYHLLTDTKTVSTELASILNTMDKQPYTRPGGYLNYDSYYYIFLAIALLLLVAESFITETKQKSTGLAKIGLMAVIMLAYSSNIDAQTKQTEQINAANDLYRKGDFKAAQSGYEQTLLNTHDDNQKNIATFNKANALFKQQQYAEAALQMKTITTSKTADVQLQSKAWYNKGLAELSLKQINEAAESFKKALMLDPNDEAARENLQKIADKKNEQKKKQAAASLALPKPNNNQDKNNLGWNKKQIEQELNMLRDDEKQLQKSMQQKKSMNQAANEKDW